MSKLESDIATIKETLRNLDKNYSKLESNFSNICEKVDKNERDISVIQTKIGIFAGLQVGFSIIVGAVAKFLQ
jgi:predicted  nucleic acid-binding Zn-ribbon protein